MKRCVNIDWLEMYCYEPSEPRTPEYFESLGFFVARRPYGTKHWSEVFTIHDDRGDDFIEVRRSPRHPEGQHHTILPDNACTLRLVNRYCYFDSAAWIMSNFIEKHHYLIRRIYRIDLAIDLKVFDSGDKPEKVMRRIVRHKYTKIYQAERTIHGVDHWNDCDDNSISWGKKKSMVVTRFYNKSLELAQVHDKPWIRQSWYESGLIDDPLAPIVLDKNGRVVGDPIWRLEFQINSSARGWFVAEGDHHNDYVEHTLEAYWNRQLITQAIANLVDHYFNFRIYEPGKTKYDCKPKELFKFTTDDEPYTLRNSLVRRTYDGSAPQALRWISRLREMIPSPDVSKALDVVEERIRTILKVQTGFEGVDPRIMVYRAVNPDVTRGMNDEQVLKLFEGTF